MIGAGRMGKVYQAWLISESRTVAVKFLRKSFLHHPGVVERFIGEARTIARLDHPHLVGIHGLGRTPGGAYFIVMDLVAGSNLDQIIKTRTISVDEHRLVDPDLSSARARARPGHHPLRPQARQYFA